MDRSIRLTHKHMSHMSIELSLLIDSDKAVVRGSPQTWIPECQCYEMLDCPTTPRYVYVKDCFAGTRLHVVSDECSSPGSDCHVVSDRDSTPRTGMPTVSEFSSYKKLGSAILDLVDVIPFWDSEIQDQIMTKTEHPNLGFMNVKSHVFFNIWKWKHHRTRICKSEIGGALTKTRISNPRLRCLSNILGFKIQVQGFANPILDSESQFKGLPAGSWIWESQYVFASPWLEFEDPNYTVILDILM